MEAGLINEKEVAFLGELTFLTPDAPLRNCHTLNEDELVCTAAAPFQFKGRLNAFDFISNAHLADLT